MARTNNLTWQNVYPYHSKSYAVASIEVAPDTYMAVPVEVETFDQPEMDFAEGSLRRLMQENMLLRLELIQFKSEFKEMWERLK